MSSILITNNHYIKLEDVSIMIKKSFANSDDFSWIECNSTEMSLRNGFGKDFD